MHVVVAQAQVAVELEDLHLALVLLGVAAERLEIGRAVLLGRLFGGPFFLLLTAARGGGCMPPPPGAPKPPGPICAAAGRGQRATGRRVAERQPERRTRSNASHASDPAQSSNSTPPVAAGCRKATWWPRAPGRGVSSMRRTPAAFELGERRRQILDLEADVVQARPAARQEAIERRRSRAGAQSSSAASSSPLAALPAMQKRDVGRLRRDVLARAGREAEQRAQAAARRRHDPRRRWRRDRCA